MLLLQKTVIKSKLISWKLMNLNALLTAMNRCCLNKFWILILWVRGVLFEILNERLSVSWSVVITSLFFTLMHFDSYNTLFYIMISIVFSFIYIKTRSIAYCIILHMCVNTFSFISYYMNFS